MEDWTKSAAGTTLKKTAERSAEQSAMGFVYHARPLVLLLRDEYLWNEQKLPQDCRDASRISWISVLVLH
jgi:hypothetical protein